MHIEAAVTLVEVSFWIAFGTLVYIYLGYPLAVFVASHVASRDVRKAPCEPTVSILIAAHNEGAHIRGTLENKLALDYPAAKLQIIVVSDGSTDTTDTVVREFAERGVLLLRQDPRNGKTAALNLAVRHAKGELLVFADANSLYAVSALRYLASSFGDPHVGYVTGKLVYSNADGSMTGDGCTLYMRYENFIRLCETRLGSVVGVNGGIDAVRRSLYQPMEPDDLPDLVLPLRVVAAGYRVVYEPAALLTESALANPRDEYRMRVRVALRAFWTLADIPGQLNVWRHGLFAMQLFSHKALRYLAFLFMAVTFTAAAVLWPEGLTYRVALLLQIAFLGCAWVGFLAERHGRPNRLLSIPYYFVLINAAAAQALGKFLRGQRYRVWNPRLG